MVPYFVWFKGWNLLMLEVKFLIIVFPHWNLKKKQKTNSIIIKVHKKIVKTSKYQVNYIKDKLKMF